MSGARATLGSRVLLASVLAFVLTAGMERPLARSGPRDPSQPNVVIILTDDQRWDSLWAMPTVQSELVGHGTTFDQSFVVNSLCCPSRASILTGKYSHGTDVYHNQPPHGGMASFDDTTTLATSLRGIGYRTGIVGKYLNGYRTASTMASGWDRWFVVLQGKVDNESAYYYDYDISDQGTLTHFGSDVADYSTDVFAGQADQFIRETPGDQPLFLLLATAAPHTPAKPPERYLDSFSNLEKYRPPNYNEADVSDKPANVKTLNRLGGSAQDAVDAFAANQYRTLLAVDDAVATVVSALRDTGRLSDTMIIFASDNGLTLAEHRIKEDKEVPYEESIRVPLVIRYDPLTGDSPAHDGHLVANIDLAPTVAELTGFVQPGAEGQSLMPLLDGSVSSWRTEFLIEHMQAWDRVPSFCAVRSEDHLYVYYSTMEEELYDLTTDPYELDNLAGDPSTVATQMDMRTDLESVCSPTPPGLQIQFDAEAPSAPGLPAATRVTSSQVDLTWPASADNVAVKGYVVYRDGVQIGTTGGTRFRDVGLQRQTTYVYAVEAYDDAGNLSSRSGEFTVTTKT